MKSREIVKVDNLGKLYQLGQIGTGTISHDLNRWWAKLRGKEDPYMKIGIENDRTLQGSNDYVWALKDISFDIHQGDTLGIIGKNGAGKSTLLKLLSRVTSPTVGQIKIKGRIAALLEVGTGFHPELTGRENIYLNGTILGMTKKEISKKFDEIVDFAGVALYIDTPVKRYSSGMSVRLAFAVAAHLEPEILIVDEVLAVGDIEFQKKCLGKMEDVASHGRTIIFVSHNLSFVKMLCNRAIWLEKGHLKKIGDTKTIISDYLNNSEQNKPLSSWVPKPLPNIYKVRIISVKIMSKDANYFHMQDDVILNVGLSIKMIVASLQLTYRIYDSNGLLITTMNNIDVGYNLPLTVGDNFFDITIHKPNLLPGDYTVLIMASYNFSTEIFDVAENCVGFTVVVSDVTNTGIPLLADRGMVWFDSTYKKTGTEILI